MNGFLNDLRLGIRQLAAKPGFAAAAILTLALGIGANAAVFSILNGYLFKPLPYPHSDRLAQVDISMPKVRSKPFGLSPQFRRTIQRQSNAFRSTAVYDQRDFDVNLDGRAQHVKGVVASASLFDVLGAQPLLGQAFTASNMHAGSNHVALISYGLWRAHFGSDRSVIGKTVKINGDLYRIIGIMPKGFAFPDRSAALWVPRKTDPVDFQPKMALALQWNVIGRLKPNIGMTTAGRQVQRAIRTWIQNKLPAPQQKLLQGTGFRMEVQPYRKVLLGNHSTSLWLLQGAVLLILLMTCANVANLLLSRILGRSHELAMRSALGATRGALVRQLLTEALCLAVPAGLVGLALAWLALHFMAGSSLGTGDSIFNIALDWRVGLFALGAVLFTTALVSLLPIRHLARTDLQGVLQEGGRTASGGRRTTRVRNALVIAEMTLAIGLLAMAGLVLHSFMNLETVDPGFRKDNVLIASLLVPPADHKGNKALRHFYTDIVQRVDSLPGVESAAVAHHLPLGGASSFMIFSVLGRKQPASAAARPSALFNAVTQGYFRTLGIPILRGRRFDDRDRGTVHAIVGTEVVKKYFKNTNPIGKTLVMGTMKHVIIGVVPSIDYVKLSQSSPSTVIYVNGVKMTPTRHAHLVIHAKYAPRELVKPVRDLIYDMDPNVAVYNIHTMHEQISNALQGKQRTTTLLLAFGGIALVLAIVGVYAVMSYVVSQRRTECGVRLVLGARPEDLSWMVLKGGIKLLAIGLVLGLGLAVLFGYLLSAQLFGVAPFDPITLIGSAIVLCLITLAACYLPARRAAKLDPAVAIMEQ